MRNYNVEEYNKYYNQIVQELRTQPYDICDSLKIRLQRIRCKLGVNYSTVKAVYEHERIKRTIRSLGRL